MRLPTLSILLCSFLALSAFAAEPQPAQRQADEWLDRAAAEVPKLRGQPLKGSLAEEPTILAMLLEARGSAVDKALLLDFARRLEEQAKAKTQVSERFMFLFAAAQLAAKAGDMTMAQRLLPVLKKDIAVFRQSKPPSDDPFIGAMWPTMFDCQLLVLQV